MLADTSMVTPCAEDILHAQLVQSEDRPTYASCGVVGDRPFIKIEICNKLRAIRVCTVYNEMLPSSIRQAYVRAFQTTDLKRVPRGCSLSPCEISVAYVPWETELLRNLSNAGVTDVLVCSPLCSFATC